MRKLASIQLVKSVEPIFHPVDGSLTSLELIKFQDIAWQCVAKAGEFTPGSKAVYIEISTVVPDEPVFEFLRARKFKVKTIRLLGVLSQGLALPLDALFQLNPLLLEIPDEDFEASFPVGTDVSEIMGVTRYEPPIDIKINGSGRVRTFPDDIVPKTDETRLQSVPYILKYFEGLHVTATLKYDGTSCTVFWDEEQEKLRVCSRNMEKLEEDGSVYFLALDNNPSIKEFCRRFPNFVLQGEVISPGVQKNRLQVKKPTFVAFNLFNKNTTNYIPFAYAKDCCESCGVPWVETVRQWDYGDFDSETVDSLLELAKGNYPGTENPREGIVIRPTFEEQYNYLVGGRLSFKVINNDYLERGGE